MQFKDAMEKSNQSHVFLLKKTKLKANKCNFGLAVIHQSDKKEI